MLWILCRHLEVIVTTTDSTSNGLAVRQSVDFGDPPVACQSSCQVVNTMGVSPFFAPPESLDLNPVRTATKVPPVFAPARSASNYSNP